VPPQVLETISDLALFFFFMAVVFVGFGLSVIIVEGAAIDERGAFQKLFTMIFGDFDDGFLAEICKRRDGKCMYLWVYDCGCRKPCSRALYCVEPYLM
jgi:hypothetical protein